MNPQNKECLKMCFEKLLLLDIDSKYFLNGFCLVRLTNTTF